MACTAFSSLSGEVAATLKPNVLCFLVNTSLTRLYLCCLEISERYANIEDIEETLI